MDDSRDGAGTGKSAAETWPVVDDPTIWLWPLAVLLLGAVVLYAYQLTQTLQRVSAQREELTTSMGLLGAIKSNAIDMEVGQRGYLLTRDPRFLLPYRHAIEQLPAQFHALDTRLASDLRMNLLMADTGRAIEQQHALLLGPLQELSGNASLPHAVRDFDLHSAENNMDRLRSELAALESQLARERQALQRETRQVNERRTQLLAVAFALAMLATALSLWLLRRNVRGRREEARLRLSAEHSLRASREKTMFLANMSHEIRTPMNAIFGFTQLLAESVHGIREQQYLKAILGSGRSLLALINDILDLSKIEAGKLSVEPMPTDLREIVQSTVLILSQMAVSKHLKLRSNVAEDVPDALMLNPLRLRQILFNLVGNAIKYTEQGEIGIEVISAPAAMPGHVDCRIAVRDSGVGIALADQARIFDPFSLASGVAEPGSGAGLGLTISRRLVQMMGGRIEVDSVPGQGSTFSVHLPAVAIGEVAAHASEDAMPEHADALRPLAILVVDDVGPNRELLFAMLSRGGHRVSMASSGAQGLDLARTQRPDLILTDIRMPGMDGMQVLHALRAEATTAAIPVIAVSASSLREEDRAVRGQFDGYVSKPLTPDGLNAEIRRVMETVAGAAHAAGAGVSIAGDGSDLASEDPRHAATLLPELDALLRGSWQQLVQAPSTHRVQDFANQLAVLADRSRAPSLRRYADELGAHARAFDVAALETVLQRYPSQVDRYRQSCHAETTGSP